VLGLHLLAATPRTLSMATPSLAPLLALASAQQRASASAMDAI